jgi:hypothetical protein
MLLTRRLALAFLALAPACQAILPTGPSNVAQGRYYGTSEPEYDDFFLRLYRLQLALKDAPKRIGEPRQKVADALSVGPDPEEIRVALTKRASELQNRGIRYTVAHADANQPPTLIVTGNPTGKDFELKGHLEGALKSAGELKLDITAWQKELDELGPKESSLESNVNEKFASRSQSERAEITTNLSDGQKIITLLVERTRDLDHATTDFLKALGTALGEKQVEPTPAESTAVSSSDPPEKKSKKGAKAPKPAAEPKAAQPKQKGAAPKPAPAPKAASKSAAPAAAPKPAKADTGDAPPPPKPAPGTAKPDFEP